MNEKEQFRFLFAYFIKIDDNTRPDINLKERRQIPDIVGTYLRTYDIWNYLPAEEKKKALRKIVEEQPEIMRYSKLVKSLNDDILVRAFRKAELLGAEMLTEEEANNEDH